jgi:hypothetical protein
MDFSLAWQVVFACFDLVRLAEQKLNSLIIFDEVRLPNLSFLLVLFERLVQS